MTNSKKLIALMYEKGVTREMVAETLKLSMPTVHRKINNKTEWKDREIAAMCNLLGIGLGKKDLELKESIFFALNVGK